MREATDKMPKNIIDSRILKKLNKIDPQGGSQITKTNLVVTKDPITGEVTKFHGISPTPGKITADDITKNLEWEVDWAGNINLDESAMLLKKTPYHKTPSKKDWSGFSVLGTNTKTVDYGPWKNQTGGYRKLKRFNKMMNVI